LTLASGGRLAIITQGPTQFDRLAAVRMQADVVTDLEALAAALGVDG
jgi:NAD-dependent deacetylase